MKGVAVVTAVLVVAVAAFALGETGQLAGEMDQKIVEPRREERIFAFYTTTSIKRLATTTITAISTCLSVTDMAPGCTGRKKRSLFSNLENLEDLAHNAAPQLESTLAEKSVSLGDREARAVKDREGRKLTVWSSVISTLTLTSTSYLAGTTITATALCTVAGLTNQCFGK